MTGGVMVYENAYHSKEIAKELDIGTSTIRKWCLLLEEKGYKFIRNEKNQRVFIQKDINILKRFKELTQNDGMTLENAINTVIEEYNRDDISSHNAIENDNIKRYEEKIDLLLEHVENQQKFNQELLKRLEEQQVFINENLEKRDKYLMNLVRETQETKRLIAATEETKKSFWQRLFNK